MSLLALATLLALSLTDPSGDAFGDGSLEPPTSPIYANAAQFDLLSVTLSRDGNDAQADGEPAGSRLEVTMGSLVTGSSTRTQDDDGAVEESDADEEPEDGEATAEQSHDGSETDELDLSSMLAVIDVYIGGGGDGADRTLAGPNMLMPLDHGWRHAIRISADGVMAVTYSAKAQPGDAQVGEAQPDLAESPPDPSESPSNLSESPSSFSESPSNLSESPPNLKVEWLSATRSGNKLIIDLPWSLEGDVELYALSGVHDPFSDTGWRQLSPQPSPWAFSGGSQASPVIDLLAADAEAQTVALSSGVLPLPPTEDAGFTLPRTPWLYLMVGGLLLAVTGLVMRARVPKASKVAVGAQLSDSAEASEAAAPPAATATKTPETSATVLADASALADGGPELADESPQAEVDPELADEVHLADEPQNSAAEVLLAHQPADPKSEPADEVILAEEDGPPSGESEERTVSDGAEGQLAASDAGHFGADLEGDVELDVEPAGEASVEADVEADFEADVEPEAASVAAEHGQPTGNGRRELVDSQVGRSYLGGNAADFEAEEAEDDGLDESFWHPRSRKPTLTEVNRPKDESGDNSGSSNSD